MIRFALSRGQIPYRFSRSAVFSVRQIRAIETIAAAVGLQELDEPLREAAQARLAEVRAFLAGSEMLPE